MNSRIPGLAPADVGWGNCKHCGGPHWNQEHDELGEESDKAAAKQGVGRSSVAVESDLVSMVKVSIALHHWNLVYHPLPSPRKA